MTQPSHCRGELLPLGLSGGIPSGDEIRGTSAATEVSTHTQIGKKAAGFVACGGSMTGAGVIIFGDPWIGFLAIGAVLILAVVLALITAVSLMGNDTSRSPFERLMSFTGLILSRPPHNYMIPTASQPASVTRITDPGVKDGPTAAAQFTAADQPGQ